MDLDLYWNNRFLSQGMIWGQSPSKTVYNAIEIFKSFQVKTVLVPGSGYGRNTKALSFSFQVDGIEISHEAVKLAKDWDPHSNFICGSVLNEPIDGKQYDAIYCYDLLHLFLFEDRIRLIQNCSKRLKPSGIMFFTCFSDEDPHNGVGRMVEEGTFEYVEGKIAHFFTESDLIDHFRWGTLVDIGSTKEILTYNDKSTKEYILRFIIVRKT
ncbi:class I SAM-dependent methyltransferase [Cohnella caldifontis]|uniref:class I SAM-dependent methyltransferase n=1 Tax=Cohnella caldifontis TaxID=3027471 RepID=UPI0023EC54CC|nr:class I SAM-dependent methyltransferase [Cohnella sp. YIM B05605]